MLAFKCILSQKNRNMSIQVVRSRHSRLLALVTLAAVSGLMLIACGQQDPDEQRPVVKTANGQIMGVQRNGADEYRGIPYGQAARWELAKAVPAWNGVLDAANFGPACAQEKRFDLTEESLSEDCLFLNVSTPLGAKDNADLPVIVWLPGGAFVGGGGQLYRLDKLAREGKIIVVSVNYRLGVFGFMPHPAIKDGWNGNLGLEDQRLALRWVKDNIARFGGDPNNVTVAGESAGGGSVCMHLLSGKKSAGLFEKALVQSASCLHPLPTTKEALSPGGNNGNASWYLLTQKTGCAKDPVGSAAELDCLKGKTESSESKDKPKTNVADLLKYQGQIAGSGVMGFSPTIANGTVPLPDYQAASVKQYLNRVPILMGGAQNEVRLYVAYDNLFDKKWDVKKITRDDLLSKWLAKYYFGSSADIKDQIIGRYFPSLATGGTTDGAEVGSMISDFNPVAGLNNCGYLRTAGAFSEQTTLYAWEFSDPNAPVLGVGIAKDKDPGMALGAVHSSELNYLFPNLSNTKAIDGPDLKPDSQRLADILVQVWASFAKTGNPATASVPAWQPYSRFGPGQQVMRFESPDQIIFYDAYAAHQCEFWSDLYKAKSSGKLSAEKIPALN